MSEDIILMLILAFVIWTSPLVAKLTKLPTPAVEILIGSTLATYGIIHKNEYFDLVAQVGFLYLMFLAGLEVDFKKLLKSPIKLIKRGLLFIFFIIALSVISGYIVGFNAIFIVSLPLISIGLLATLSKTYGKGVKWLEIAFIVGIIGEIASIITLTILDVASETGLSLELVEKLGILFGFIALIVFLYKMLDLVFWWMPELKDRLMPKNNSSEQDIRLSMALFFILIVVMIWLHLELALGAFIAGVAISAFFHHNKELEEKMGSFGFGFLVPLFFIHVGTTFDLKSVMMDGVLVNALLIVSLAITVKVLGAIALKEYIVFKEGLLLGLSLSMPLTLLVAVATIGYKTEYITILNYYSLILAAILEIVICMVSIKVIVSKFMK